MAEIKEKPRCPHQAGTPCAYDFDRDKVYEGTVMCSLVDKYCLLEQGLECDTYNEFLKELESER